VYQIEPSGSAAIPVGAVPPTGGVNVVTAPLTGFTRRITPVSCAVVQMFPSAPVTRSHSPELPGMPAVTFVTVP